MRVAPPSFVVAIGVLALAVTAPATAQQTAAGATPPQPTLTLDEAVALSRRNNPAYQQVLNNRRGADAAVRSAYAAFLPSADAILQTSFREGGEQVFSGLSFRGADTRQSSYSIGLNYTLNSSVLINPRLQRANRDAVDADIADASESLRATVIQQYLTVLQAQAKASLQDTLVVSARAQVELARVRETVGSATQLDVRRAEVALGELQVAALQARNDVEIQKLRLFRDMGVAQPASVTLTTAFAVAEPAFTVDQLLELARQHNPQVKALRWRAKVAGLTVRRAHGEYTPTLSLSTGWGGYTFQNTNTNQLVAQARAGTDAERANCIRTEEVRSAVGLPNTLAQCSAIVFTDATASSIRAQNEKYPFDFTSSPRSLTATVSLPLFDNLTREQRVQEALAGRSDARHRVRARELDLTAGVTAAYLDLRTAAQTVALQEQTALKAREELAFTEERYRVGAVTFLDVTTSRDAYGRAENARINAIYDYHKAFAALESAVGRPLR